MRVQDTAEVTPPTTERTKPYRVAEIAIMLDVHPVTVYRDIKAGRLRALRTGKGEGAIRILPNALMEYFELLEVRPSELAEVA